MLFEHQNKHIFRPYIIVALLFFICGAISYFVYLFFIIPVTTPVFVHVSHGTRMNNVKGMTHAKHYFLSTYGKDYGYGGKLDSIRNKQTPQLTGSNFLIKQLYNILFS